MNKYCPFCRKHTVHTEVARVFHLLQVLKRHVDGLEERIRQLRFFPLLELRHAVERGEREKESEPHRRLLLEPLAQNPRVAKRGLDVPCVLFVPLATSQNIEVDVRMDVRPRTVPLRQLPQRQGVNERRGVRALRTVLLVSLFHF